MSNKTSPKLYLSLHLLIMLFSLSSVCSKLASAQEFLSFKFCLFYGLVLFLLALYAVFWQQIIKNMSLTAAYANKAVTVVWGLVWGMLIFGEKLTSGKVIGCVIIISGVLLFAFSDKQPADLEASNV